MRRKRAKARLAWYLFRKGYLNLAKADLLRIHATLSAHHSRDQDFLQTIDINMAGDPWQCGYCRKTAKASANNCSHCGASWEDANPSFIPPERGQSRKKQSAQWQNSWNYSGQAQGNSSWNQRPKTPRGGRRRQGHGGKKGQGHGGQKGQHLPTPQHRSGKGHVGQSEGYAAVPDSGKGLPPEPPWHASNANLPSLPPMPPPSVPHPDVQATAVQTLNKIAAVVKNKPEKYDPEVHALLQGAALAEGLSTTDKMYQAVADLGHAREALDAARLGRSQNHVRWRDFLASAVTRWQEYTADFQKQEAEFTTAIEQARACIANAKERFESCKAKLTEDELKEVGVVSPDEAMADRAPEHSLGNTIQEGLEAMAANLVSIKTSAEAMVIEEQASNKRPRLGKADGGGHSAQAAPSSLGRAPTGNALEPFADRSEMPSFHQPDKM